MYEYCKAARQGAGPQSPVPTWLTRCLMLTEAVMTMCTSMCMYENGYM